MPLFLISRIYFYFFRWINIHKFSSAPTFIWPIAHFPFFFLHHDTAITKTHIPRVFFARDRIYARREEKEIIFIVMFPENKITHSQPREERKNNSTICHYYIPFTSAQSRKREK